MGKEIVRTKQELEQLKLLDTRPRVISSREKVELFCSEDGQLSAAQFGNVKHRWDIGNPWVCKKCAIRRMAEKQASKTGDKNPFFGKKHSPETIQKIKDSRDAALQKSIETNRSKYGTDFPSQNKIVEEKRQQTNKDRYGHEQFMGSPEFIEKSRASLIERFGVDNPTKSPEVIEKIRNTIRIEHGADWYSRTQKFKDFMSTQHPAHSPEHKETYAKYVLSDGSYIADLCNQKNVNISNGLRVFNRYGEVGFRRWLDSDHSGINALEAAFMDEMGKRGIELERFNKNIKACDSRYRPDFRYGEIYINIDGLYSHSDMVRDDYYHAKMRSDFENSGMKLLQFREDEMIFKADIIASMIKNTVGASRKLNGRDYEICEIEGVHARKFFENNHLMGSHLASRAYGIVDDSGGILACMSVRISGEVLEISRFATVLGASVRGGFSKLLSHVIKKHNPNTVVSFCDLRYSYGNSYKVNGFAELSTHIGWVWANNKQTFNRLYCRANMDERRLSQEEHAKELKLFKIYDAGQRKYIKKINKI